MTRRRAAAVVAALLAAAVLGAPAAPAAAGADDEAALARRMIARVNLYRVRTGREALRPDPKLAAAARAHARDMAANDFFAHRGSDGSDIGGRIARAGYRWRRVAENIAGGLASPEATVDGWMASKGHRRNLLDPALRDAGAGHALRDPDPGAVRYRHYWVLVLARPAPP